MQGRQLRGLSDDAALRRAGTGDRAAMAVIVERHQDAVHRYVCSLTTDAAAAEDALQQAFLDAMRGAAGFQGRSSVRRWLLTLARNAHFRACRLRAGEPRAFVPLDELGTLAGWGEDPEVTASRTLDRAALQRALAELDGPSREIIVLRDLEGLSGREAAEVLGLSLPAMKSRLHRARLELAAAIRRGGRDAA